MKHKVVITEILKRTVEVEATSRDEAWEKVDEQYRAEKIVLDSSDFDSYDIQVF